VAWFLLVIRALIARRGFTLFVEDIRKEREEVRRKKSLGSAYVPSTDPDRLGIALFLLAFLAFLAWLVADGMHVRRWIVGSLMYAAIFLVLGGVIVAARAATKAP